MHTLLTKEFRPVAANEILSSQHFPDDMQDDFLICNTIGFLGIKQYSLDRGGSMPKPEVKPETPKTNVAITRGGGLITVKHPAFKGKGITGFKLSVNGNQEMNISEVEVISGNKNIAKTAALSQSSEYNSGSYPATLLADGNKGNFAHTAKQKNPWMKGDFPSPVEISELRVWNRKGFEQRFNNGKIEFFNGKKLVAAVDIKIKGGGGKPADENRKHLEEHHRR